jgi:ribosomal protein L1
VKKSPNVQVLIGNQSMRPEQVIDNVKALYQQIATNLPKEENNVRAVYLKTTMGKPIRLS